jgi:hypothetical protein
MNELIFADVRVVPIGMLFEKIRLAAGLAVGKVAPPMSVMG